MLSSSVAPVEDAKTTEISDVEEDCEDKTSEAAVLNVERLPTEMSDGDAELPLTKAMTNKLYQALMETGIGTLTDSNLLTNDQSNGIVMLPPLLDAMGLNMISKKGIQVSQLSGTHGFSLLKDVQSSVK